MCLIEWVGWIVDEKAGEEGHHDEEEDGEELEQGREPSLLEPVVSLQYGGFIHQFSAIC